MSKSENDFDWQKVQSVGDLELGREHLFRPEFLPSLYSYLGIRPRIIGADVGCGTGSFSRLIACGLEGKGKIVGIDLDMNLLSIAEKRAKEEGLSKVLEFKLGDAYNLPFPDNYFDVVTSHTLVGVLKDPLKCILEKKRVAKVGGTVSVVENIPGLKGYSGVGFPKQQKLRELQEKSWKIWVEKIYPKLGIGSEIETVEIPRLFMEAGLKDIKISGYLCTFSISDTRYSLEEMKEYLSREYENDVGKIKGVSDENRKIYHKNGFTEDNFKKLLSLLEEKFQYLTQEPNRIRQDMRVTVRPRIIVAGTKM